MRVKKAGKLAGIVTGILAIIMLTGCPVVTVEVSSVTLDKNYITLKEGESSTISATVYPSSATDKSLYWYSQNETVATVSGYGIITAEGEGVTNIVVESVSSGCQDVCTVIVTAKTDNSNDNGDNTETGDTGTEDSKPDTEDEEDSGTTYTSVSSSYFWGEWTRMDNGKSFVVGENEATYDGYPRTIISSTDTTMTVSGTGTFEKESDSVMVCSNIPYFRNGGTNLKYKLKVVGFTKDTGSRAASTKSLKGIKGKGKSKTYKSFTSEGTSDENGEITLTAPTINDTQTVTIEDEENQEGNKVVVSDLKIENSGDYMGTVALVDADQYNLKITGTIETSDKNDGYLYGNNSNEYPMTIAITNISNVKCTTSICKIDAEDDKLKLSSSTNLDQGIVISTLPKGGTKKIQLKVEYGNLSEAYVDTGINITITNPNTDQEWTDYIPLRFYKGTLPIAVAAKSPETNSEAALNGFIIYPDGNNQFFSITEGSSTVLYVPTFGKEEKYKMIFSGATVTEELSDSTEMFYTVAAGSKDPTTPVTSGDVETLTNYIKFGGNNHTETEAYDVAGKFEAYLSEGEIDYYNITADSEEFYSPSGKGYYEITYTSEYDTDEVPEPVKIAEGTVLTSSQLPELTDDIMNFDGWYAGITKVNPGVYTVKKSVNLTARWSYKNYSISYELNGGTNSTSNKNTYTYADTVILEDAERDYCTFAGWYETEDFSGDAVKEITSGTSGNKTLYAKWTPWNFTITYELNDGGTNADSNPVSYNIDTEDITLAAAVSSNSEYAFGGWYETEDCSGIQTAKIVKGSYGDITLYAKWAEKKTVTYVSEHGTVPAELEVADGTILSGVQLEELTDEDYLFEGWYTEGTYCYRAEADSYTVTDDVTLYAKWAKKCTVTYVVMEKDGSAYSETPEAITVAENTCLTEDQLPVMKREKYVFHGWYTDNVYGSLVIAGMYMVTEDVKLYAYWEEWTDGFVHVEGGTYYMGSSHNVTLSGFYMSPYEVTQAEYEEYCTYGSSSPSSSYGYGESYPAYYVSWYDAIVYCNRRSMAAGFTPCYTISGSTDPSDWGSIPTSSNSTWDSVTCDFDADGYRLPTEAEWEYAAKGGINNDSYTYSGSDTAGSVAWYNSNSSYKSHIVGLKSANSLGIYDMSGNLFEWCWDWYGSYSDSEESDPTGPSSGSCRVTRGGGYYSSDSDCRVVYRDYYYASSRYYFLGFRLCRSGSK